MPTDGETVPYGSIVFRCSRSPDWSRISSEGQAVLLSGQALPEFFNLSSADQREQSPSLSVWLEGWTTANQAWRFRGSDPEVFLLLSLSVDEVRRIRAPVRNKALELPFLEIVHKPLVDDVRPGGEGHCGILHLDSGDKQQRRFVRDRLAQLASGPNLRRLTADEMT